MKQHRFLSVMWVLKFILLLIFPLIFICHFVLSLLILAVGFVLFHIFAQGEFYLYKPLGRWLIYNFEFYEGLGKSLLHISHKPNEHFLTEKKLKEFQRNGTQFCKVEKPDNNLDFKYSRFSYNQDVITVLPETHNIID